MRESRKISGLVSCHNYNLEVTVIRDLFRRGYKSPNRNMEKKTGAKPKRNRESMVTQPVNQPTRDTFTRSASRL